MILILTKDLMVQSSVSAAARALDKSIKPVGSSVAVAAKLQSDQFEMLLVDLQTPGLDLSQLSSALQTANSRPPAIAFAQHVMVDLLDQAKACPFDKVLTRGQFTSQLGSLLQSRA